MLALSSFAFKGPLQVPYVPDNLFVRPLRPNSMSLLFTAMQNMRVLSMSSSTEALWLDLNGPIVFGSVNMGRVPKPEGTAWQRHRPGGTSLVVQWLRLYPSTAKDKS